MTEYIAVVGMRCPDKAKGRLLALPSVLDVVKLPFDPLIAAPIADHPDSLICIYKKKLYCHTTYAESARAELEYICSTGKLQLVTDSCERHAEYPFDCAFNVLVMDDRQILIGRRESLVDPLKSFCNAGTNQGYSACTSLYADGTVITADPSIEKAVKGLGVPVYRISGKDIVLPGYNEGFIGGAGGAFESTVCLFGSPEHSESAAEVESFCRDNSLSLVCLEDDILTDRGGIMFVPVR